MRNNHQYHKTHGDQHTGPDHHPLSHAELAKLTFAWRNTSDAYERRSIERRLAQGVAGMVYPAHCAATSVRKTSDEAVELFRGQAANRDEAGHRKLCDLLGIAQAELPLNEWEGKAVAA